MLLPHKTRFKSHVYVWRDQRYRYRWIQNKIPLLTCEQVIEELQRRYKDRKAMELSSLRHNSLSVAEYIEAFEGLVAQVPELAEEQYMGYFLNGLRKEIRHKVQIHGPRMVMRAIELSQTKYIWFMFCIFFVLVILSNHLNQNLKVQLFSVLNCII